MLKPGDEILTRWGEGIIRKVFKYNDGSVCYSVLYRNREDNTIETTIVSAQNAKILKIEVFDIEI